MVIPALHHILGDDFNNFSRAMHMFENDLDRDMRPNIRKHKRNVGFVQGKSLNSSNVGHIIWQISYSPDQKDYLLKKK